MIFNKIFKSRKPDDGVRYISNITRSLSVMIDLVLLICILLGSLYFMLTLIRLFYSLPIEALEKVRLNLDLTSIEKAQVSTYYFLSFMTQVIQLVIIFVYTTFMWCKLGTTPAKFLFGVRIVDADTFQKITFKQATIRFFSLIISILPLCLGVIWSIFDRRSQGWHDKIANTVLIVKNVD